MEHITAMFHQIMSEYLESQPRIFGRAFEDQPDQPIMWDSNHDEGDTHTALLVDLRKMPQKAKEQVAASEVVETLKTIQTIPVNKIADLIRRIESHGIKA